MTELKNKNLKRESKKGKKKRKKKKEKKKKENSLGPLCPRSHAPRNLPSSHQLLLLPKNDYSGSLICSSIPMYTYRNRASVFVMLINLKNKKKKKKREREILLSREHVSRSFMSTSKNAFKIKKKKKSPKKHTNLGIPSNNC